MLARCSTVSVIDGFVNYAIALRKALAAPIAGPSGDKGTDDRTKIARALVVSINKGLASLPGDRLMRTTVTITPATDAGASPFVFAGYSIAATDNKVQSIAHLEDETDLSLKGSLAPKIGGFGDNGVEASVGRTKKATVDMSAQYENLNVDILPDRLTITRESERGLDVVGNTLVSLTLAAPPSADSPQYFIASSQKLFEAGKALTADKATFAISPLKVFADRDLRVNVTLSYVLRRVVNGREYYTEGKQSVQVVADTIPAPADSTVLVRAADAQPTLYMVCVRATPHRAVSATTVNGQIRVVTYDELDDARAMATWLTAGGGAAIGKDGITLKLAKAVPLPPGARYYPMPVSLGCAPKGPAVPAAD